MPELPEVEAIARALKPFVVGETIRRCEVLHAIAARPSSGKGARAGAAQLVARCKGRQVKKVERRGKYLVLHLDRGRLVLHFKMGGTVIWFDNGKVDGHIDVALYFRRGALGYVDPRHLGRVWWHARPEDVAGIARLGPDPLSAEFTADRLDGILRRSRRPLKLVLMDQSRIAGMGNVYASEALWHARLDPRRPANRLQRSEVRRLHKAIVGVLRGGLECCLDPAPNLRDPHWEFRSLDDILRVYGREGEPCARCGRAIRRIQQGNRSTYFCGGCQH